MVSTLLNLTACFLHALQLDDQAPDVKIIDTILYNGEPIFELRLQLLYDVVDEFVIVEARETHSGVVKDELFTEKHAEAFEQYKAKMTVIIIDTFPNITQEWRRAHSDVEFMNAGGLQHWYRENYQRNAVAEFIVNKFSSHRYIVLVCDADELPKPNTVLALKTMYDALDTPVFLAMQMYYYNFNWTIPEPWLYAYAINGRGISAQHLSEPRVANRDRHIADSGWHCSYFLNTAGLIRKLQSFAHKEFNVDSIKQEAYIRQCITNGKDLLSRGRSHDLVPYDVSALPIELQHFNSKLLFLQEYA
jgi:beta-1,4-mannosyl-glycoprotein beta-1,4-N-acetylglucosaminyltransferase